MTTSKPDVWPVKHRRTQDVYNDIASRHARQTPRCPVALARGHDLLRVRGLANEFSRLAARRNSYYVHVSPRKIQTAYNTCRTPRALTAGRREGNSTGATSLPFAAESLSRCLESRWRERRRLRRWRRDLRVYPDVAFRSNGQVTLERRWYRHSRLPRQLGDPRDECRTRTQHDINIRIRIYIYTRTPTRPTPRRCVCIIVIVISVRRRRRLTRPNGPWPRATVRRIGITYTRTPPETSTSASARRRRRRRVARCRPSRPTTEQQQQQQQQRRRRHSRPNLPRHRRPSPLSVTIVSARARVSP